MKLLGNLFPTYAWRSPNLHSAPQKLLNPRLLLSSPPPQGLFAAASPLSKATAVASSSPSLPSDLLFFLNHFTKPMPQIFSLASDMQNPRVWTPSSPTRAATRGGRRSTHRHSFSVDWWFTKPRAVDSCRWPLLWLQRAHAFFLHFLSQKRFAFASIF